MKRKSVIALAVAAVLVVSGVALAAVALEMGALEQLIHKGNIGPWQESGSGNIGSWSSGGEYDAKVDSIIVNWTSGSVLIEAADVDEVSFSESADRSIDEEDKLVYRIEKGSLYIDYCKDSNTVGIFGDGFDMPAKQLKITVPLKMMSISLDTTSADVTLNGVEVERLKLDTTSGNIKAQELSTAHAQLDSTSGDIFFEGSAGEINVSSTSGGLVFKGSAGDFSAESTSGDISFEGSTRDFGADTTSGAVTAVFTQLPGDLEVETVSGDVELFLPENSKFALEFDTASGELFCDFEVRMHDGEYIVGGGGEEFSVDTTSGDCTIKKNK